MKNLNLKNIKNLKIKVFSFMALFAMSLIFCSNSWASTAECKRDIDSGKIDCSKYNSEKCLDFTTAVHRCCPWIAAAAYSKSGKNANSCFDSFPFQDISDENVSVTSAPGMRTIDGKTGPHHGYDYGVPIGTVITAAAYGVITNASSCDGGKGGGYGRYIDIEHPKADTSPKKNLTGKSSCQYFKDTDCYTSRYGHLSKISVAKGEKVNKGTPIGQSGGSGCSGSYVNESAYAKHLHFETLDSNGHRLDPNCAKFSELCGGDFGTGYEGYQFTPVPEFTAPAWQPGGVFAPTETTTSPSAGGGVGDGKTPPKGTKECSISEYRDTFKTCIFCDIFQILFNTASDIAKKAFRALADGISKLIVLGLAIWLSANIIKYVSAMEQKEPKTFIKEILNQIFVVLIVYIFLKSDSATFFGLAMEPIFNTGMKLAQMATGSSTCTDTFNITKNGGLPASMGVNILCTIKSIQGEILDIMALGSTSMCVGFFIESYWGIPIFPHLGYVIVGLLLWISALLLMIIYPFLLIDSVLQLSVACALLPAAMGAYAFKITQKYVGKIWETFLNCMFTFVFLSIIIFILTYALKDTVGSTFEAGLKSAGIDSDYSIILDKLAWWGTTFLKLIFIMILGWAVLGEAKGFAGTFAGSVGVGKGDIGSSVGALGMSAVKAAGKPVMKGAGNIIGKGATAVGRTTSEKMNNARVGFQAWRIKNSSNAKTDADGNISVTSKSMFGRQITRVLSTDASGKQSVSKTKTKGNGTSTIAKTDAFMSVKEKRDSNGNVISRNTEMKAAGAKYLINKDGSTNQIAINALKNNSQHGSDVVNEAMLNQMLKERMPGIEGATLNGSFKERNVRSFKNDKGQDVFEVSQLNNDGSRNNFRMSMSGNRALTEYEVINKNGSAMSFASDGIVNKKSSYKYNNDGANGALGAVNANSVKNRFSFTSHYKKRDNRPMDSNGVISNSVPKDEIMFEGADMAAFADQIASSGQSEPLNGFK